MNISKSDSGLTPLMKPAANGFTPHLQSDEAIHRDSFADTLAELSTQEKFLSDAAEDFRRQTSSAPSQTDTDTEISENTPKSTSSTSDDMPAEETPLNQGLQTTNEFELQTSVLAQKAESEAAPVRTPKSATEVLHGVARQQTERASNTSSSETKEAANKASTSTTDTYAGTLSQHPDTLADHPEAPTRLPASKQLLSTTESSDHDIRSPDLKAEINSKSTDDEQDLVRKITGPTALKPEVGQTNQQQVTQQEDSAASESKLGSRSHLNVGAAQSSADYLDNVISQPTAKSTITTKPNLTSADGGAANPSNTPPTVLTDSKNPTQLHTAQSASTSSARSQMDRLPAALDLPTNSQRTEGTKATVISPKNPKSTIGRGAQSNTSMESVAKTPTAVGDPPVQIAIAAPTQDMPTRTGISMAPNTTAIARPDQFDSSGVSRSLNSRPPETSHNAALTPATKQVNPPSEQALKAEAPMSLLAPTESMDFLNWDPARQLLPQPNTSQPLRADFAPQIARQMIEVLPQAVHRPVEIALSPVELGRVRMSVTAEDGAITVSILTERPETLDLMRRHIDQLGQTFRSIGYEQITFAFGQGADTGDQPGNGDGAAGPGSNSNDDAPLEGSAAAQLASENLDPLHAEQSGIDIRL